MQIAEVVYVYKGKLCLFCNIHRFACIMDILLHHHRHWEEEMQLKVAIL